LKAEISDEDLISAFTPTEVERRFIADAYSRATVQALKARFAGHHRAELARRQGHNYSEVTTVACFDAS